eukprot:g6371.t1
MSKFSFTDGVGADDEAQKQLLEKFKDPQHFMKLKERLPRVARSRRAEPDMVGGFCLPQDPKQPFERMLEVDEGQLVNAKEAELMKPVRVRFLQDANMGRCRSKSQYPKAVEVPGVSGQATIRDLRLKLAKMEDMPLEEINLFAAETNLTDETILHECYLDRTFVAGCSLPSLLALPPDIPTRPREGVIDPPIDWDWMGSGLDDWPPRLTVKPRLKGFELHVSVPPMRDTSEWDKGRLQNYQEQNLIFDVQPSTTVRELKQLVAERTPRTHSDSERAAADIGVGSG